MATVYKCLLSAAGVLTGYAEIDDSAAAPGDLTFAVQPDLPTNGTFRWNGESFVPVRANNPFTPDGPDAWYAIYRFLRRVQRVQPALIPAPTALWLDYYRRAFTGDPPTE